MDKWRGRFVSQQDQRKVKAISEAVLGTCFCGSDGQNIAGITGSQAVPGKYADIIGGGVHL